MHIDPLTGENYGAAYNAIGTDVQGAADFIHNAVSGKEYAVINKGNVRTVNETAIGVQDLLKGRKSGLASGSNWKTTYLDLDMSKGISVAPGQKIRVSLTVSGANHVMIVLLVDNESPGDYPRIKKIVPVKDYRVDVEVVIPQWVHSLKQVGVAHGDQAWDAKIGSQLSQVTFTKVELVKDDAASYGGIDLQKIDLRVDAASGAVSFEVNDAVVAALQEKLFGLEPVIISSVPLINVQKFLAQ